MIEIRSVGFIEICADLDEDQKAILDDLDKYFGARFQAERLDGYDDFCDRYYKAGDGVFKGTAGSIDSNFALLATDVCDTVVKIAGWSLVASNCGLYGDSLEHCEQQLVFRRDEHPLGDNSYLMVILNAENNNVDGWHFAEKPGNVEINGKHVRDIHPKLDKWLQKHWKCSRAGEFQESGILNRRYTWPNPGEMLQAAADMIEFFEAQGWEIQVTSQSIVNENGQSCVEQQLLFRPGMTEVGTVEPHLLLELYAGEGKEELYEDEETTQVLANQHIRVLPIGMGQSRQSLNVIMEASARLRDFFVNYLGGTKHKVDPLLEDLEIGGGCLTKYAVNIFLCRGRFENNLAQWTMRVCDFLVDTLGWSFIVCSLCNKGEYGQFRSQQLVFRWDGDKRELPVSSTDHMNGVDAAAFKKLEIP